MKGATSIATGDPVESCSMFTGRALLSQKGGLRNSTGQRAALSFSSFEVGGESNRSVAETGGPSSGALRNMASMGGGRPEQYVLWTWENWVVRSMSSAKQ